MESALLSGPQINVNESVVRLVRGDITELEVDAFVFYAREDLALGSGFGGMISIRGGPSVQKELDELAPVAPLQAVVSGAGRLPADHIIHAVGPRFREDDIEAKLMETMENTLARAEENELSSLAFPAMGAGYYGIPNDVCARVMVEAVQRHLQGNSSLNEVVICVLDTPQFNAFESALARLS
jgi:O-acetyl-ADP-ribose deacetylase (regulator of RNase III)